MKYKYEDIIKDLNEGRIESVLFSIQNYSHYNNCLIFRHIDLVDNDKRITRIEVKLVKDNSETISFYKKFNEKYKLFKMGRRGSFTLKEIWKDVKILQIKYNDFSEY